MYVHCPHLVSDRLTCHWLADPKIIPPAERTPKMDKELRELLNLVGIE